MSYYEAEKGLLAVGSGNSGQKVTEDLAAYSDELSFVQNLSYHGQYSADSCWETGNIYFINNQLQVIKMQYDKTILSSILLTDPRFVSVIQNGVKMSNSEVEDRGCWIYDFSTGKVIRTSNTLVSQVYATFTRTVNCIAADNASSGCYVLTGESDILSFVTKNADILYDINMDISNARHIRIDSEGFAYVANATSFGKYDVTGGSWTLKWRKYLTDSNVLTSIDIDLQDNSCYVCGASSSLGWVLKYDKNGNLSAENSSILGFVPKIIRVAQRSSSQYFYLLNAIGGYASLEGADIVSSSSSSSESSE